MDTSTSRRSVLPLGRLERPPPNSSARWPWESGPVYRSSDRHTRRPERRSPVRSASRTDSPHRCRRRGRVSRRGRVRGVGAERMDPRITACDDAASRHRGVRSGAAGSGSERLTGGNETAPGSPDLVHVPVGCLEDLNGRLVESASTRHFCPDRTDAILPAGRSGVR